MRPEIFHELKPLCLVCSSVEQPHYLELGEVSETYQGHWLQGLINCSNVHCRREFLVLDGLPLLIPKFPEWLQNQSLAVLGRDDLQPSSESVIGDALGPNHGFHSLRLMLNSYGCAHYGDQLALERPEFLTLIEKSLVSFKDLPQGPLLDLGCNVGRAAFEMAARFDRLCLGVDLNVSFLRMASRVLIKNRLSFPKRSVGMVFERIDQACELPGHEQVDFWACDILNLPFAEEQFAGFASYHVLDSVPNPPLHMQEARRVLTEGGLGLVSCPFDWADHATPYPAWLGGHSQRGPHGGQAEPVLDYLLAQCGLKIEERQELSWTMPMHARAAMHYLCLCLTVRKAPPALAKA